MKNDLIFFNYKILITILLVIIIFILAGGFYLYQNQKNQIQNDALNTLEAENRKLIEEVGKLMELPDGDPIIVPVTDITKLQDQPFFQKAKNGDIILIYLSHQKAILYNPITKTLIDTAPINIGPTSAQKEEEKEEPLPIVAIRNGTKTVGLTTKIETKLKKDGVKFETGSKENAEKQNYEESVVVIVNESSRDFAERLANILGVEVGDLPEGEVKADNVDVIVILGKDAT